VTESSNHHENFPDFQDAKMLKQHMCNWKEKIVPSAFPPYCNNAEVNYEVGKDKKV